MSVVFLPLSVVYCAISLMRDAFAVFHAVEPFALKYLSVSIGRIALSMWLALLPLADLFSSVCPGLGPIPVDLVVLLLSFLDGSTGKLLLSLTVSVVVLPGASLLRAVTQGLGTSAVFVISLIPGAFLSGSIGVFYRIFLDQLFSIDIFDCRVQHLSKAD